MVGFGFMDNIIMIQAGDFIDATLGVTFGLTTLTAAALGNVCSDSSGVLFGGLVESMSEKLQLAKPNLTAAQAGMRVTRMAATGGALIGVICGCCLGMTNLLFMDLEATEKLKRAQQLETIFEPVMRNLSSVVMAERCTLYLYDDQTQELWTRLAVSAPQRLLNRWNSTLLPGAGDAPTIIRIPIDRPSLATHAARSGELLNIADAKSDPRHDKSWDERTGFVTRAVLCFPIFEDGKLYGCLQAVNKRPDAASAVFTTEDEKLMKMLSSHISIFVQAVQA